MTVAVSGIAISSLATGCGSSSSNAFAPGLSSASGNAGGGGAASNAQTTGGDAAASGSLPPETKIESNFLSPVATGTVVWVANPSSGRVAYIDATSFNVKTVVAGAGPTYLAAIPDPVATDSPPNDLAIVLNVASQTATLFKLAPPSDGGADIDGTLTSQTFGSMPPYANAWAVSPSGRWAIAWTNTSPGLISNPDPLQGYSEIAVIDVTGQKPPTLLSSVGYLPVQIAFSGDAFAYVVTQDGIAVVDLGGATPTVTANYPLVAPADGGALSDAQSAPDVQAAPDDDAGSDASASDATLGTSTADGGASGAPDVSFTADASYALVRRDGVQSISVIDLATGATTLVPLPALPTDLTISPTGTFAVAVLRDTSAVVTLPIPGIATDPTSFTTTTVAGQTIGRAIVTAGGETALLFTTAAPVDMLTVLTFQPAPTYRSVTLHAPVLAVFPTPDGQNAVVLHQITPTATDEGAFSVVPVGADLPASIQPVPAPPTQVALTNDRALITVSNSPTGALVSTSEAATYGVYVTLMPSLVTVPYPLASAPVAVGIMPEGSDAGTMPGDHAAYVAQNYPDGRITFIDLDGGGARTITGFDLSAGIIEGTEQ